MSCFTSMTRANRGSFSYWGLVVLAAALEVQCAGGSAKPKIQPDAGGAARAWALPTEALETQRLFRVRYEGQEGRAGMKLVLKLVSETRFQVLTSDSLGRPLWSLQTNGGETRLVDHRSKEFCSAEELRLPDPVLESMPLQSLPRVLLGYLPSEPATIEKISHEEMDFRSADGRRWTSRLEAGRSISWVLWEKGRPVLWWSGKGGVGTLSHRQGIQIRWREIVSEPLQLPLGDLQVPNGYRPSECDARNLP